MDETFCLCEGLNRVKRWGKDGGEDGKWLQAVDLGPGAGGDVAATEWGPPAGIGIRVGQSVQGCLWANLRCNALGFTVWRVNPSREMQRWRMP